MEETAAETELHVEVRLASGEELARLCLQPCDIVSRIFTHLPVRSDDLNAESLLLGTRLLDPHVQLRDAGVTEGAVLTLIRSTLMWSLDRKGCQAEIGPDRRTAWRVDGDTDHSAIVVSSAPMRTFRVRVVETIDKIRFGGLEVGFTATELDSLPDELPNTLDKMPRSWVSNCVGSLISDQEWIIGSTWDEDAGGPNELEVNDVVACTACTGGQLCISKNGRPVATWKTNMPEDVALYAIVNIVGRVKCVELLLGRDTE